MSVFCNQPVAMYKLFNCLCTSIILLKIIILLTYSNFEVNYNSCSLLNVNWVGKCFTKNVKPYAKHGDQRLVAWVKHRRDSMAITTAAFSNPCLNRLATILKAFYAPIAISF